jgi:hypothetical protein
MQIDKYQSDKKNEWDAFVRASRNGTFLFCRDFMEYHAARFTDSSLLCYDKDELVALLPANRVEDMFYSHQGLTYGGFVLSHKAKAEKILNLFSALTGFLREQGIKKLIYKPVPHIYHRFPSEEDLYALFRQNATLKARLISSVIDINGRLAFARSRKGQINKALKNGLTVAETADLADFWPILEENLLKRYQVKPIHSLKEIEYLKSKFPNEIRLFVSTKDARTLAGCVVFETEQVAHVQYISTNEEGKHSGALDLLFDHLLNSVFAHKRHFDFGTSNENNGHYLNGGLIAQKEGFGGRGIVYDCWEVVVV